MNQIRDWWINLSIREKWLIGVAGGLFGLVILWQAILVPALSWRAAEQSRSTAAFRSLEAVQRAYFRERAAGEIVVVESEKRERLAGDRLKGAIIQSATDAGLSISRLQSGDGVVSITIERADPRIVFFWLQELEINTGAVIKRLVLETSSSDQVRTSVDLRTGGG